VSGPEENQDSITGLGNLQQVGAAQQVSVATLLLWLYYTSLIFLFGAEFTACLGGLRNQEVKSSGAMNQEVEKAP
jgi:uncharacterized BrkB/YihY/UPF0761 family membrane protein